MILLPSVLLLLLLPLLLLLLLNTVTVPLPRLLESKYSCFCHRRALFCCTPLKLSLTEHGRKPRVRGREPSPVRDSGSG